MPPDPTFFADRDLGRQLPSIIQSAGIDVEIHDDHFPQDTPDPEWLAEVGRRGWAVLSKDQRIRYNEPERKMVKKAGIPMFLLIGRNATHPELGRNFVNTAHKIINFWSRESPPFIAKVYRPTPVSAVENGKPGRVEMWLPF